MDAYGVISHVPYNDYFSLIEFLSVLFLSRVFILFIPRRNLRPGPRDVTVLTTITINSPTGSL